jgi:hypothetical protein
MQPWQARVVVLSLMYRLVSRLVADVEYDADLGRGPARLTGPSDVVLLQKDQPGSADRRLPSGRGMGPCRSPTEGSHDRRGRLRVGRRHGSEKSPTLRIVQLRRQVDLIHVAEMAVTTQIRRTFG